MSSSGQLSWKHDALPVPRHLNQSEKKHVWMQTIRCCGENENENHSSEPCRIDLDFNGYYTSFPKEKENIEIRGKWNPTSKPKLQQHQLTKWILLLHCTQQILSEGIIMIRHKSVSCLNIQEHLRLKPWEDIASTLSVWGARGAENSNPFLSFWSVV